MVSWRVKCVVLGEIHCYTNLILDNSKAYVPYLIFYLNLQSDGHNTVSFPVLFQFSKLSNHVF